MSLHTNYRPKDWKQVIGQDAVVSSLKNVIEKKSSNTFLFIGPSGTGKTTLARIAAAKLGCSRQSLLEIDAATYTGIDDIRSITSSLNYRPMVGEVKAIIIDECQALSAQAWKALLKSLEEPPSWVYWFLCTTDANKVPKNIKTRCTTYNLKPVKSDSLIDLLREIADKERLKPAKGIIELCAREAEGSPRQAIVNMEVCVGAKNKEQALELMQSASEAPQAIDLARALLKGAKWKSVQELLSQLKETNAESVRHVVRAYMTNVILGAKDSVTPGKAMEILDEFGTPFSSGDGISPLVIACGHILLAE